MEDLSNFLQASSGRPLNILLAVVGISAGAYLLIDAARARVRRGIRIPIRRPFLGPALSLGTVLSFAPAASALAALPGRGPKLHRIERPPWLESSGFSPPRPLVRAGDAASPARFAEGGSAASARATTKPDRHLAHPAIHGRRSAAGGPLFPRVSRIPESHGGARVGAAGHPGTKTAGTSRRSAPTHAISDAVTERVRRGLVDLRRSERLNGRRPRRHRSMPSHYTVMPGDTLWGIAGKVLGTDDVRAIARFWPRIHRENRDIVPDPNLIRPGQVLSIPRPDEA